MYRFLGCDGEEHALSEFEWIEYEEQECGEGGGYPGRPYPYPLTMAGRLDTTSSYELKNLLADAMCAAIEVPKSMQAVNERMPIREIRFYRRAPPAELHDGGRSPKRARDDQSGEVASSPPIKKMA